MRYNIHLKRIAIITFSILMLLGIFALLALEPSNDRDWVVGHDKLPLVTIVGERVHIQDLRDFTWTEDPSETLYDYVDRELLLTDITGVEVLVSRFLPFESMAHTFLNFTLASGEGISVSVEARREQGEEFSPFAGLVGKYELIYTVSTYSDAIGLRHDRYVEEIYKYPTIATSERAQELFVSLSEDINALHETPKFYNLVTQNCTNTIVRNVEKLTDLDIPMKYATFQPGKVDQVLFDKGIIKTEKTLEATRKRYLLMRDQ